MASLAKICKNTLMVCGVMTAILGVAGGVLDLIKNGKSVFSENPPSIERSVDGGEGDVHRGGHGKGGGRRGPASIDTEGGGYVGGEEQNASYRGDEMAATMSAAPETDMTGGLVSIWVWLLVGGLGVVFAIIGMGWLIKKGKSHDENTGS
jgi:hypothetical protein